jgi:carboxyl-terminal processing protease
MPFSSIPPRKIFTGLFVLIFLVGGSFFVGLQIGYKSDNGSSTASLFANGGSGPPVGIDFAPLWKAWHTLDEKFVPATTTNEILDEDKVWGIIQGLASSFDDPYTVFLPPIDNEIFEEDISGSFGGVGMEIGIQNDTLTVIAPLKGTPADNAGIQAGDKVYFVDDESTDGLSIEEAVQKIRGEIGTKVKLTIAREGVGEFLDIDVVRDVIKIPTINTELTDKGVFVIELYNFSAVAANEFRLALREFVSSGTNKLLLDLRGNPGGFLEASVDISSWFLPSGKVVVQEHFGEGGETEYYRSRGYNIFNENLEMAILINRGSASASEILAGALREHNIATLIGDRTFGKGSVQELVEITSDTSLKVTIARWLTPNGTSISDGGLSPDIEIKMTPEDIEEGRDPQKERAIEFLLTGE